MLQMIKYSQVQELRKQAAAYTKEDWEKYVPEDERKLYSAAEDKFVKSLPGIAGVLPFALGGGPVSMLGGMITGGFTPTWTRADLQEYVDDPKIKTKNILIPGYQQYKTVKLNGYRMALVKRLLAAKAEAEKKK
jgi:hypothetical protein